MIVKAIVMAGTKRGKTLTESRVKGLFAPSSFGRRRHYTCAERLLVGPKSTDNTRPGKASAYKAGHLGSIPGFGRSPGEGNGNPLQYSCLENPMDRGAWWATVQGAAELDVT